MRILGLDVGSKTVGVALSDPLGWVASSLEIIPIDENINFFGLERLGEIIKEKQVTGVVIGLPKNMNNTQGPRVDASKHYGKLVEDTFKLPVDYIDERLTTVSAEKILLEADLSREKRKSIIDKLAAQFILQNYLDAGGKLTK
jgi:putative Holliday junction resolvase